MTNTKTTTHQMTTTEATAVLLAYDSHKGEPGGILITDTPRGLKAHYTSNPGNIAGRMLMIDTATPIEPKGLRTPENMAAAINAALDDADAGTDDRDQTNPESDEYWNHLAAQAVQEARQAIEAATDAKRHAAVIEADHVKAIMEDAERTATINHNIMEAIKADDRRNMADMQPEAMKDTGRTYETQTVALELANIEPLYTAAREAIKHARQLASEPGRPTPATTDAEALEAYVADIIERQDTRKPTTALLVALANAATCRVDWSDVAAQLIEVDEISEEELEAAAAMMDKLTHTHDQ
jgi:hypothetical protein